MRPIYAVLWQPGWRAPTLVTVLSALWTYGGAFHAHSVERRNGSFRRLGLQHFSNVVRGGA